MSGTERQDQTQLTSKRVVVARDTQYLLLALKGAGNFGEVWKAAALADDVDGYFETDLVAIKFLHPAPSADGRQSRRNRELEALSQINSPHVVRVIGDGTEGDRAFLVLEYVAGGTLRDWLTRRLDEGRPPEFKEALWIFGRVCRGVQAAHACGIVHLDLKPENVVLAETESARPYPKVVDFGLARFTLASHGSAGPWGGTDPYMSIEHAAAAYPARSSAANSSERFRPAPSMDVFSLGVLLVELLTLQNAPLGAAGPWRNLSADKIDKALDELVLKTHEVPREVFQLARRTLDPDASRRPADAQVLLAELIRICPFVTTREERRDAKFRPPRRQRKAVLFATALILLAVVGVTFLVLRTSATGTSIDGVPPPSTRVHVPMSQDYSACVARARDRHAPYVIYSATMFVNLEEPGPTDAGARSERLAHFRTAYDLHMLQDASRERGTFVEEYGSNDGRVERWVGPEQEAPETLSGAKSEISFDAVTGDLRTIITGATVIYPIDLAEPTRGERWGFKHRLSLASHEQTFEYPNDADGFDVICSLQIVVESTFPIVPVGRGARIYRGSTLVDSDAFHHPPTSVGSASRRWLIAGRWANVAPGDHAGLHFTW